MPPRFAASCYLELWLEHRKYSEFARFFLGKRSRFLRNADLVQRQSLGLLYFEGTKGRLMITGWARSPSDTRAYSYLAGKSSLLRANSAVFSRHFAACGSNSTLMPWASLERPRRYLLAATSHLSITDRGVTVPALGLWAMVVIRGAERL